MQELYTYLNQSPPKDNAGGRLSGTRVAVQPNLSVAGWPCDAGSRALSGYAPLADATVIERLIRSGAVLSGSVRMGELGFGLAGDSSAHLVAAGRADLALVTDTMGEARAAAAGAGLFGFKPSWGLVSRCGLIGLAPSLECIGLVAADPLRIAGALSVMAGGDPDDPSMPDDGAQGFAAELPEPEGTWVAGVVEECLESLTDGERDAFEARLAQLAETGMRIRPVNLAEYALFRDVHQVIASVEASSSAGKYDGVRYGHRSAAGKNWNEMYLNTRGEAFGPLVKTFLFQGAYFQFENYEAFENACRIRGRLVRAAADLLGKVDLLVSPTLRQAHDPAQARTVEDIYAAFGPTLPANVTGQPAMQVPGAAGGDHFDTGLQLSALRLDDARLLALGVRLASQLREGK